MSTIQEIESAIRKLSPEDLASLRDWLADYDGDQWDRQIEADMKSGKLDSFAKEALDDLREGRCRDL